ncbi:DUF2997 domain-containing protein [Schlesneria paludicola]|uniref:DUF2997 domain-containing protein n=1 Tax=Schlesneria paludicola TaxID=360056 RepID=UPI00029AC29E|nr:DUF2997 domain-containing protein [Schlesneria paludicola]
MPRQIEILITPTGETQIVTRGFQGSACLEATKALEQVLGRKLVETLTPDFYQVRAEDTHIMERPDMSR